MSAAADGQCVVHSSVEVLAAIFLHVSDYDLLKNCRRVSRLWLSVIDGQSLWKERARRRGGAVVVPRLGRSTPPPVHFYRTVAIRNPFGRNLIRNACGESGDLSGWTIVASLGDKWKVENPPKGCNALATVDQLEGIASCFVTSYDECRKHQVVDLWREGCGEEIWKLVKPRVHVSEWYAARFDCGCKYSLDVRLLDSNKSVVLDKFAFEHVEQQWTGAVWNKVEHTFDHCAGAVVRYVHFEHAGVDRQFWAGHYGSKMTNAQVRLRLQD